ncbi:MAG: SUF system Fe-S cluster assembly regulator [Alphaproteobacteria bacterium]|nr:SUF system Fe-S cluster assembly regulator [Alphaproteobacteria bacterium]
MLRLAKLTDYAIVVLAHLAREAHVCVHPASAIAEATGVPQPTVAKVLKSLTREGLVLSSRGVTGGYSLARDPARISVVDVIAAVEGPLALTACAVEGLGCTDEHHCQVAGHWPRINGAVIDALRAVSILDLSRPDPRALSLPPALARS